MNQIRHPRIYKFMNKGRVDDFLKGKLRISDLSYYRRIEGPEWIADREEGMMSADIPDLDFSKLSDPDKHVMAERVNKTGFFKVEGEALQSAGISVKIRLAPSPTYVVCFSTEPFDSVMRAMCLDAPRDYRYDACVEILDIGAFCQAILDTGSVNGVPLGPEIASSKVDKVSYQNRHVDVWHESPPDDPTFAKPTNFRKQQEVRFAMYRYSDSDIRDERIDVDFSVPDGILREIPLDI